MSAFKNSRLWVARERMFHNGMPASRLRGPVAAYVHYFNATKRADDIRYRAFVVDFDNNGAPHVTDIDLIVYPITYGICSYAFGCACVLSLSFLGSAGITVLVFLFPIAVLLYVLTQ
jgi:hypothetical protein